MADKKETPERSSGTDTLRDPVREEFAEFARKVSIDMDTYMECAESWAKEYRKLRFIN